ncbi:M24 family metallopeptidase [Georgenia thermotolerans]|uniref:M24 family metallopeptidase n=1 Tax=Georgenia thermotolerans TaxID=527326 RepID=A0A7J5UTR3_9MICO|nr:Xaa-Pro peptidase family protein [Georgenia thermotolerans]KAE8765685.1 M24 family metallopeptidase [Georgenia thermotolerans]
MTSTEVQSSQLLFSRPEYEQRLRAHREYMDRHGLDHLILVQPESLTYLSGYMTAGYTSSFAAGVVSRTGDPALLIRHAEEYWYRQTSWCPEPIWWYDGESVAEVLLRGISELGLRGRIGMEGGSWRAPYQLIAAVMDGVPPTCTLVPDCDVSGLRLIKSEEELQVMRRAGEIADKMVQAACDAAVPGITERDLAAHMSAVGIRAGSGQLESGPVSSGAAAKHIHASYTDRVLEPEDLVFIEVDTHSHNYYARCMRSIRLGARGGDVLRKWNDLRALQDEAFATVKHGVSCRIADSIIRDGLRDLGYAENYPNKTFYGLGFMLVPTAYEPIEVTPRSDFLFESGMTLHGYLVLDGLNISETIVVREDGIERLTNFSRDLIEK